MNRRTKILRLYNMKTKNYKVKENWYKKNRNYKIFHISKWILDSPEALTITMLMAFSMTLLIFGGLAIATYVFNWAWILIFIFGGIAVFNTYKLFGMIKLVKRFGTQKAFESLSIREMVFRGNKNGKQ